MVDHPFIAYLMASVTITGTNKPHQIGTADNIVIALLLCGPSFFEALKGNSTDEFALRSGLGLRFVRELEQGKETVRMDKVNQALSMFGTEAVPGRKERKIDDLK